MKQVVFLALFVAVAFAANSRNLYQTCTNGGRASYSYYGGTFYDYGAGVLPYDAKNYTYFNATTGDTLYFNLCAGLEVCDGAMACIVDKAGVVYTYTYPFYAASNIYGNTLQFCCTNKNLYISLSCSSSTTMTVYNYEAYSNQLEIYGASIYACPVNVAAPAYVYPTFYSSLSAPFYMKGRLPYFLQDYLGNSFNTEFVGNIYYSEDYGLTINGTISLDGQSHFVSFIYEKEVPLNPPRAVSYIRTSSSASSSCRIQGTDDNSDYDFANDIFASSRNQWISLTREYTSVHFSPGTQFTVNTYTQNRYDTQATLITRVSDGKLVYIAPQFISPWIECCDVVGEFINELDWNNISSAPLGKDSFTPPTTWNCGF